VYFAKTKREVALKWKALLKPEGWMKLKKYLESEWMSVKDQFCHA
jgi:hypothetical protein